MIDIVVPRLNNIRMNFLTHLDSSSDSDVDFVDTLLGMYRTTIYDETVYTLKEFGILYEATHAGWDEVEDVDHLLSYSDDSKVGIPEYKLRSSDGWILSDHEISSSILLIIATEDLDRTDPGVLDFLSILYMGMGRGLVVQ